MIDRIKNLRTYIFDKHHHQYRHSLKELGLDHLAELYASQGKGDAERVSLALAAMMSQEQPVILPGEKIVLTRTVDAVPDVLTAEEWAKIKAGHYIHERGYVCNISPDYAYTLKHGLGARRQQIAEQLAKPGLTEKQTEFLRAADLSISSLQGLLRRYAKYADEQGQEDTAQVLRNITEGAPTTLREALQLLRAVHYTLWAEGNYHNTLGRFDQYMLPYYRHDIEAGTLTKDEAFDLVEEFFLVCNKDSDLYPGMQQGDNGQSLVLGGRSLTGEYLWNDLSEMCLRASYELRLIDPKINIRVDSRTPQEIFTMGSRLTKIGLGFPQYSNDDVVIPGLMKLGYTKEDAYDYVVAACWEFILPGVAMDIPNIDALSLVKCVKDTFHTLPLTKTFDEFYARVEQTVQDELDAICSRHGNIYMVPAPMMSVLMDGCIERAADISEGSKYNNYGIHGTGIASAVDSLAAIKKYYFEDHSVSYEEWADAVDKDFKGHEALEQKLRTEAPKMGNDDDEATDIAVRLLHTFSEKIKREKNDRGGIYRAGTGTAMYYIFHATSLGATPDGRKAEEMIPANYSPSMFIKTHGPLSVIKSFCKPDLSEVINGGPLTLEFDSSIFRGEESIVKLGMLVKTFIALGGHQLQLNTVCREKLLDAKKHPENYRNLIVRVWGWSGYFVELDECYQDHVINRIEFGLN